MSTINTSAIDDLRDEEAPLHYQYPLECNPQDAYIEMDEDGIVSADWNGETGNSVPMYVWHGRTMRFSITPCISGNSLYELVMSEKITGLLQRIHDGHSVEWDGNNNVGSIDEDATSARHDLERLLEDVDPDITVWTAYEWLFGGNTLLGIWDGSQSLDDVVAECESFRDAGHIIADDLRDAILNEAHTMVEESTPGLTHEHIETLVSAGKIDQEQANEYIEEFVDAE